MSRIFVHDEQNLYFSLLEARAVGTNKIEACLRSQTMRSLSLDT